MQKAKITTFFSLLLTIVYIGPFLYITRFIYPSYDDFCRGNASWENFFPNIKNWLLEHNGRYFNAVLSFIPVYEINTYRIIVLLSIICFAVTLYYFLTRLLVAFQYNLKGNQRVLVTLIFLINIIDQLPSIYEFFYWYAGITTYLYSFALLFLLFGYWLQFGYNTCKNLLIISGLIILINGNNEMALIVVNIFLLLLLALDWSENSSLNWKLLSLNVISWVSSLIVVFTPGTIVRRSNNTEAGDFLYSVKLSLFSTGAFILENLMDLKFILFWLAVFLFLVSQKKLKRGLHLWISPFWLGSISLGLMVAVIFVLFYAQYYVVIDKGRIGNFLEILFNLLVLLNILNFLSHFYFSKKRGRLYKAVGGCLALIFLGSNLFFNSNLNSAITEITSGRAEKFDKQMNFRLEYLKNSNKEQLILDPIPRSEILGVFHLAADPEDWKNRCYVEMINHLYNLELKSIGIDWTK